MKKQLLCVLIMTSIYGLAGCAQEDTIRHSGDVLTLDIVTALSEKGEALTWSDFEAYESTDVGSGLYILAYDIDETYSLWIGGGSLEKTPMYMRLFTKEERENWIDIRTGDVKAFIAANAKETEEIRPD